MVLNELNHWNAFHGRKQCWNINRFLWRNPMNQQRWAWDQISIWQHTNDIRYVLNHWVRVTHIWVSGLCHHPVRRGAIIWAKLLGYHQLDHFVSASNCSRRHVLTTYTLMQKLTREIMCKALLIWLIRWSNQISKTASEVRTLTAHLSTMLITSIQKS